VTTRRLGEGERLSGSIGCTLIAVSGTDEFPVLARFAAP
jgi:hypothetical protein